MLKKKLVSVLLAVAMVLGMSGTALAAEPNEREHASSEYYMEDGTFVEQIEFEENGEYAAVIKRTYADGTFDVTAVNGDDSVTFQGVNYPYGVMNEELVAPLNGTDSEITFPRDTPYWYGGCDDYSYNEGLKVSVAIIAGLIASYVGLPPDKAVSVAEAVYTGLSIIEPEEKIYFRTERYYATRELGIGEPTIWYNKFVTYTYSDAARTEILTGPTTKIFETLDPL